MSYRATDLQQLLQWQSHMGVTEAICDTPINRLEAVTAMKNTPKKAAQSLDNQEIKELIKKCTDIDGLKALLDESDLLSIQKTATNTLFADGNLDSKTLIIADCPTSEDDASGQILSGDAGSLWDRASAYAGLNRQNTVIIPYIFWRPAGGRRPTNIEINLCSEFIKQAIIIIQPELIISFNKTISNILQDKHKQPIYLLSSPVSLIKQPAKKRQFWQDMLKLQEATGCKNTT